MLTEIRAVFLDAAQTAIRMVEHPAVTDRWDAPAALDGYTVGGLAAHLCRAVSTPNGYLETETPGGTGTAVADAADYFRTALADHDPVDGDIHLAVRQRSDDMAASGPMAVIDATRAAHQALAGRLEVESVDRRVGVFGGLVMGLDDYLETRIVELVIHADDLAASCPGLDSEPMPDVAWAMTRRVVVELAARRVGERDFVLGLSRAERAQRPLAF